jgi:hypothetical protein
MRAMQDEGLVCEYGTVSVSIATDVHAALTTQETYQEIFKLLESKDEYNLYIQGLPTHFADEVTF